MRYIWNVMTNEYTFFFFLLWAKKTQWNSWKLKLYEKIIFHSSKWTSEGGNVFRLNSFILNKIEIYNFWYKTGIGYRRYVGMTGWILKILACLF